LKMLKNVPVHKHGLQEHRGLRFCNALSRKALRIVG
jgi:hypothetical protein